MYASGVIFSIQALSLHVGNLLFKHPTLAYVLQINPAAVYITLSRYALLQSQRLSMPGAKPYNARICSAYAHTPAVNPFNSAYCHPALTLPSLWLWAVVWAVVAVLIGFVYFWRAEARYGRG
jgi:teichoic acid transport system permease protein